MAVCPSLVLAGDPIWPPPEPTPVTQLAAQGFWPNDPSYAPPGSSLNPIGDRGPGQWWLYSFVPERDPAALLLRKQRVASGLSVDAAWRYGTGSHTVVLAFLDDGIDWTHRELSDNYVLNAGELQLVPPLHSDGSPCARLVPTDPNSPRLDCALPPDGLLTVRDFEEALRWHVGTSDDDPNEVIGDDPNKNGILDPEDIAVRYGNNVDDDENGLVDDIVGWNFAEGNAELRHRVTTHGTEVALDAMARANDGKGRAGVCPSCLGIPIRVADQRGADPQRLALAILYAASRGVKVALVGHLPLGRSETLERAIRTAAQRGMLVLFPQDGEQQNHSPLLFDVDTWLPVGALTTHGLDNRTDHTISFVELDPSQSLGPGPNLMGSGPAGSRRAQSIVLGVAGLVASSAEGAGRTRLTPLELASTLKWTADPIDSSLTSPTDAATSTRPSICRVNANSAVEAARADLVPPELNLERPYWHEPILEAQSSSLAIVGQLSANRADTVDIQVSMAIGATPADTSFQIVYAKEGLDKKALAPSGSTLATLDPRTFHQNANSSGDAALDSGSIIITIRVKATAHHTKLSATTSTEVERRIVLLRDPDLTLSTPTRFGFKPTAPKLADIDGDGVSDIVFGDLDGNLTMLAAREGRLVQIPPERVRTRQTSDFLRVTTTPIPSPILEGTRLPSELGFSPIVAPPAIADLNGDGQLDVIVASLDGALWAFQKDGGTLPGWGGLLLPEVTSDCSDSAESTNCSAASPRLERGISSSPVVADMNGDGLLEVVVAAHDGKVHAYQVDGRPLVGWPVAIGSGPGMQPGRLTHSPAVGDLNEDSIDDLVVTAGEERNKDHGRGTHFVVLGSQSDRTPRFAEGWPVGVDSYDAIADRLDRSTPPAAIDGTVQYPRALLYGNSSQPFYLALVPGATQESDPEGHTGKLPSAAEPVSLLDNLPGFRLSDRGALSSYDGAPEFSPMLARPSIGDLDRDSVADVVLSGITLQSLYALRDNSHSEHQALLGLFSGQTGQMLPAAPIALDGFIGATSAAIADLTNDGYPEVIVPNGGGSVLAVDVCGRAAPFWPKTTGGSISNTPAVGDIDNDKSLEVVVTTDDGWLYVWRTQAKVDSYVPWASAQNDIANRSHYERPPTDAVPFPLNTLERCISPTLPGTPESAPQLLSARGGCSCGIVNGRNASPWFGFLGGLLFTLGRRRGRPTKRHCLCP